MWVKDVYIRLLLLIKNGISIQVVFNEENKQPNKAKTIINVFTDVM